MVTFENRSILKDVNGRQIIVPEKSSGPSITALLVNETNVPITLAQIQTAVMTIYARDEPTLPVINSVDHKNIKNANEGTIHATSGLLTILLDALDNSISNAANETEWHRILIEIGYDTVKSLKYEIDFPVRNLNKVT